jgi:hypothetical protein
LCHVILYHSLFIIGWVDIITLKNNNSDDKFASLSSKVEIHYLAF